MLLERLCAQGSPVTCLQSRVAMAPSPEQAHIRKDLPPLRRPRSSSSVSLLRWTNGLSPLLYTVLSERSKRGQICWRQQLRKGVVLYIGGASCLPPRKRSVQISLSRKAWEFFFLPPLRLFSGLAWLSHSDEGKFQLACPFPWWSTIEAHYENTEKDSGLLQLRQGRRSLKTLETRKGGGRTQQLPFANITYVERVNGLVF